MKRVVISGYHGCGNCGDEAILFAMVNNLRQTHKDLEIVAFSKNPKETKQINNIKSINRVNIFSMLCYMLRTDLVLSGGGSLLQDVTSTRSLIYYLSIIIIAKILNKPVMVYANGIGPINKKFNRYLTKFVLNKVDVITLRDEDSKQELCGLGVSKNVIVTADPVFTLNAVDSIEGQKALKSEGIKLDKPIIGISIRNWKTLSDFENKIAEVADNLINKYNCNILFIPMQLPNDLLLIHRVKSHMKNKAYIVSGKYSVQEYIGIIGNLSILISMRLHTLIFAAVQKVPMVGLVYDPKVKSFLNMINQPSAGSITDLDTQNLYQLIDDIFEKRQSISLSLGEQITELKKKAKINDDIVVELLEKN